MGNKQRRSICIVIASYHSIIAPRSHDNTTKCMEHHANKTNRLTTGKTVLQSVTKTGKPIFVYLRMSTKKKNQEDSIENQNNKVLAQVRSLGINIDDIQRFEDAGVTWFKNIKTKDGKILSRPREWLTELLSTIDAVKVPCLLFAYDPSRLARNSSDGGVIIERLWHNWNKQKIEKIYFSMGDGDMWDNKTPKTEMQNSFMLAERESEKKWKYMKDNILGNLNKGIFPPMTPTPPGLKATKKGLEITDKMLYIQKAMEMRIEGKSLKAIHTYISSHGIKTSLTSITNSIFLNSLYIGTYQDRQWEIFENLRFISWKPPISPAFFVELKKHISKKTGWYGEKQEEGDIIAKLLSWEQDTDKIKSFSLDTKKDKHKNYKSSAFWGFSRSETKIIKDFIDQAIPKIIDIYFNSYTKRIEQNQNSIQWEMDFLKSFYAQSKKQMEINTIKEYEGHWIIYTDLETLYDRQVRLAYIMALYSKGYDFNLLDKMNYKELFDECTEVLERSQKLTDKERLHDHKKQFILQHSDIFKRLEVFFEKAHSEYWKRYWEIYCIDSMKFLESFKQRDFARLESMSFSQSKLISAINESNNLDLDTEKCIKQEEIKQLQNQKQKFEEEKKTIMKNALKGGFTMELANETIQDTQREIETIEWRLEKLWESTDIEQFLERLPEVLSKTFELASKVLSSAEINTLNDDLRQLIELVTFELEINTKKELTVKLFEGLNNLVFLNGAPWYSNLRTFIENYDRVAKKYNFNMDKNIVLKNSW